MFLAIAFTLLIAIIGLVAAFVYTTNGLSKLMKDEGL